jgi:hypothetical protein
MRSLDISEWRANPASRLLFSIDSQVANSGQTATMNCTVEGFPIESVEWLHDGLPVLIAQDTRVRLPAPLILVIGAIGRRDKGMYQCLVRSDKENAQATSELRLGGKSSLSCLNSRAQS